MIEGLDENGQPFQYGLTFFAGSKTVPINIQGASSGMLAIYLVEHQDFKISMPFNSPNFAIENVPDLSMVFDVYSSTNEFAFDVLQKGINSLTVQVLANEEPSTIRNDDFSLQTAGWNIIAGTHVIASRVVNGETIPNNFDLNILAEENSSIELKRSFYAHEADKFVTLRFDLQTTSDDEEVHVILRNETTRESIHQIYLGKDHKDGPSPLFDIGHSISVEAKDVGDIVSLYIKTMKKPSLQKRSNTKNSVFLIGLDKFVNESVKVKFYAHNLKGPQPLNRPDVYTKDLKYISIGEIPASVSIDYKIPFNFLFENKSFEKIAKIDLIIEQKSTRTSATRSWTPTDGEAERIANENNGANNYQLEYIKKAFEKIKFDHYEIGKFADLESPVFLYLAIHLNNGDVHYSSLGRPLTPLEYRQDEKIKYFSGRDDEIGGDSWGQKFVWDLILNIFNFHENMGFKINDLSRLNGGHFNVHFEHREGVDLDFRFDNFYKLTGNTETLNQKSIKNTLKLISHASVTEQSKVIQYVDKIFLSFNTRSRNNVTGVEVPETNVTDLRKEQRAGCTIDNRTVRELFVHSKGHVNHGHIRFMKHPYSPVSRELFANFRPYFKRDKDDPYVYDFEAVSTEFRGDEQFIWDIRRVSDDSIVEVIDNQSRVTSSELGGTVLKVTSNRSSVRYRFPGEPSRYKVNLVVARYFLDIGESLRFGERCLSQSFDINVDPENPVNCSDEWQTLRGRETIDPVSSHKHLGGAIVSKDSDDNFKAGRFFVEDDTSAICGNSEIIDSYPNSSDCTEENKYSCASILLKGLVGIYNSKIDASQGRVLIAGTDQPFFGHPVIAPTDAPGGVGRVEEYTEIYESSIIPKGNDPIVIINSEIDGLTGRAYITDNAFVQQSNVWWATVSGNSDIKGATVNAYKGDVPWDPQLTIKGDSEIFGSVSTSSRLDIENVTVDKTGVAGGAGIIKNSLLSGGFAGTEIDPGEFNSTRIAKLLDSTVLYRGWIGEKAQVLDNSIIGQELTGNGIITLITGNSIVKNRAWIAGDSQLNGDTNVNGPKVKGFVIYAENTSIDGTIGGTKDIMELNHSIFIDSKISGTTSVNRAYFKEAEISDDAEVTDSSIHGFAKMAGKSKLSNSSKLIGTAYLLGTVHVTSCHLSSGTWIEGVISPVPGSPCEVKKLRNLASDSVINQRKVAGRNTFVKKMNDQYLKEKLKHIKEPRSKRAHAAMLSTLSKNIVSLKEPRRTKAISSAQLQELGIQTRKYVEVRRILRLKNKNK